MSYNYEAFQAVLEQIKNHPESFNMSRWCGTSKCIAGWACFMFDTPKKYLKALEIRYESFYFIPTANKIFNIQDSQEELLYFSPEQDVIRILNILVSQKDLNANLQQSIAEIADSLGIKLGIGF